MRWKHFVVFAFATLFCLSTGRLVMAQDEFDADADYGDGEDLDAPAGGGGGLTLTAGTMQVGGYITFQIDTIRSGDADAAGGGVLTLAPTAGFFIIDHLELLAEVGFSKGFGDAHPRGEMDISFGVGAKYFIPLGLLSLYAGGLFGFDFYGYEYTDVDGTVDVQQNSMLLSVPVGLLIALNQWVGLDVGARFNFRFGLGDFDQFTMDIPIGYFGIQGFFKLGG